MPIYDSRACENVKRIYLVDIFDKVFSNCDDIGHDSYFLIDVFFYYSYNNTYYMRYQNEFTY